MLRQPCYTAKAPICVCLDLLAVFSAVKLLSLTAQHTHEDLHRCSLHQCSWLLVQVYKGIKNGVQDVAVKVLANADETQLRFFEQEIKMMKQVSFDRNIVQVRCFALWQVSVLAGRGCCQCWPTLLLSGKHLWDVPGTTHCGGLDCDFPALLPQQLPALAMMLHHDWSVLLTVLVACSSMAAASRFRTACS